MEFLDSLTVARLCVRAGFSAENSERATKLQFTKKCRTETFNPSDAKLVVMWRIVIHSCLSEFDLFLIRVF